MYFITWSGRAGCAEGSGTQFMGTQNTSSFLQLVLELRQGALLIIRAAVRLNK